MSRRLIDIQLFFGSYAPLFILLGLRFEGTALRIACFAIGVLCALDLGFIMWQVGRSAPKKYRIERIEDRGSDVAGYLVTYLLPFLIVAQPSVWDLTAYALFIAIVGVIYVRSGLIYVNPLLYVVGYRLSSVVAIPFGAAAGPGLDMMLISKQPPKAGQEIWASPFRAHLLVIVAPPRNEKP